MRNLKLILQEHGDDGKGIVRLVQALDSLIHIDSKWKWCCT